MRRRDWPCAVKLIGQFFLNNDRTDPLTGRGLHVFPPPLSNSCEEKHLFETTITATKSKIKNIDYIMSITKGFSK